MQGYAFLRLEPKSFVTRTSKLFRIEAELCCLLVRDTVARWHYIAVNVYK
jgi:hypothetical protein